jgi:hypothetical protein
LTSVTSELTHKILQTLAILLNTGAAKNGFMEEQEMVVLARKAIEDLRKEGVSPTELKRLENILKEGSVGESLILSGLLRTIRNEISADAAQKKLLQMRELRSVAIAWSS